MTARFMSRPSRDTVQVLAYLDDVAREQEWDEVVPLGIQHLSKYQGHWVAAPVNAHPVDNLCLIVVGATAAFARVHG